MPEFAHLYWAFALELGWLDEVDASGMRELLAPASFSDSLPFSALSGTDILQIAISSGGFASTCKHRECLHQCLCS